MDINLSLDKINVEATCISVVREYLARKNLKATLKTLDEECPRDEKSLNSRTKILEYLKIHALYETNKKINKPYAAVLELIMSYLVENDLFADENKKQKELSSRITQTPNSETVMGEKQSKPKQASRNDIKIDDTEEGELAIGSEKRFKQKPDESETVTNVVRKTPVPKERPLPSLKQTTNISTSKEIESDENLKFDNLKINEPVKSDLSKQNIELKPKSPPSPSISPPIIESVNKVVEPPAEEDEFDKMLKMKAKQLQDKNNQSSIAEPTNNTSRNEDVKSPRLTTTPSSTVTTNTSSSQLLDKNYIITPIDYQTATALKTLVYGTPNTILNDEWKYQAFTFCDYPKLKYGFVQKKGGPCGVLASLQAYLIIELLFGDDSNCNTVSFNINKRERSKLLARAIAKLLWKCGHDKNRAFVCIPTAKAQFAPVGKYRSDGVTETLNLLKFEKYENLIDYLMKSVSIFETDDNPACVLLLYSAILSRDIKSVQSDMDVQTSTLMGQHFYCTQEMVNLLIHGKAFSNVFNDTIDCDQVLLKGPDKRNDIGLLSLYEHYRSCEVGSYYKTPKYPVWVICSESHFSVLFSLKKEILSDWKAEKKFDLYYYDGLAKQDDQIKLSIDSTKSYFHDDDDDKRSDDLIPPLELVIRTKWKDTRVDWNGYDPIL